MMKNKTDEKNVVILNNNLWETITNNRDNLKIRWWKIIKIEVIKI